MRRLYISASYTPIMKTSSTVESIRTGPGTLVSLAIAIKAVIFPCHFCFLRRCAQAGQFTMARKLRKTSQLYTSDAVHSGYCKSILLERRSVSGPNSQDVLNGALGDQLSNLVRPIIFSCHSVCDGSGAVQGWPRNEGISFLDLRPAALASGTDAREHLGHYSIR